MSVERVVALRKESVDRNTVVDAHLVSAAVSLSARRAWIEMVSLLWNPSAKTVALRKESVDRNSLVIVALPSSPCRSPQGERG